MITRQLVQDGAYDDIEGRLTGEDLNDVPLKNDHPYRDPVMRHYVRIYIGWKSDWKVSTGLSNVSYKVIEFGLLAYN